MKKKLAIVLGILFILIAGIVFFTQQKTLPLSGTVASLSDPAKNSIILIPGHGGDSSPLHFLRERFEAEKWDTEVLDISDGTGDLQTYAETLKQVIIMKASEGYSVNLIGYSAGGIIGRIALLDVEVQDKVGRVVTIASPHAGTKLADLGEKFNYSGCGIACQQLATDSALITELPTAGDPSRWVSIYINEDEAVRPDTNAILDGATNINMSETCPNIPYTHGNIPQDTTVIAIAAEFLKTGTLPLSFSCIVK